MEEWMEGKSPHSIGLCPLLLPLPGTARNKAMTKNDLSVSSLTLTLTLNSTLTLNRNPTLTLNPTLT